MGFNSGFKGLNYFTSSNIYPSISILERTKFFSFKRHHFCFARGYFKVVFFTDLV